MAKATISYKNPLAQAFGLALKTQRAYLGKSSEDIAEEIGIGHSFYRLIESGTNNLHINKVLNLINAFQGTLSFDGVSKVLMSISIMEATAKIVIKENMNYSLGLKVAMEHLTQYDAEKLGCLLDPLQSSDILDVLEKKGSEEVEKVLYSTGFSREVQNFITEYDSYGKLLEDIQSEFLDTFFDDIPSYYVEFLGDMKEKLKSLPVKIVFSDLATNWEKKHQNDFVELYAVVRNPGNILNFLNLKDYQYEYLWGREFKHAYFIFLNDTFKGKKLSNSTLREIFTKNLVKSYKLTGGLPKDFKTSLEKIEFKLATIDFVNEATTLLSGFDNLLVDSSDEYDATWAFALKNRNNVGFQAVEIELDVDQDYYKFQEGICMTYRSTYIFLKNFRKVWQKL